MKILIIGYLTIPRNSTGGSSYIDSLLQDLRRSGHHTEILSVMTTQKVDSSITSVVYQGIIHNYIKRDKNIFYTDFQNPYNEVENRIYEQQVIDFFKNSPNWDVVHFQHFMPLSIIEKIKNMGYKVFLTLHDFQYVLPFSYFGMSYKKLQENPAGHLSINDFSYKNLTEELIYASNNMTLLNKKDEIKESLQKRVEYGKHLINNVVDKVIGNGSWPIQHHMFFNTDISKLEEVYKINPFTFNENNILNRAKRNLSNRPIIFGVTNYITEHKGFELLLYTLDKLREYSNQFEFIFYGGFGSSEYKNRVLNYINSDNFLKKHTSFIGGYSKDDLPFIYDHVDFICNPDQTFTGGSMTNAEARFAGIPLIETQNIVQEFIHYGIENNNSINDNIDYFNNKYSTNIYFDEKFYKHQINIRKDNYNDAKEYLKTYTYDTTNKDGLVDKIKFFIENKNIYKDFVNISYNRLKKIANKSDIKDKIENFGHDILSIYEGKSV